MTIKLIKALIDTVHVQAMWMKQFKHKCTIRYYNYSALLGSKTASIKTCQEKQHNKTKTKEVKPKTKKINKTCVPAHYLFTCVYLIP